MPWHGGGFCDFFFFFKSWFLGKLMKAADFYVFFSKKILFYKKIRMDDGFCVCYLRKYWENENRQYWRKMEK